MKALARRYLLTMITAGLISLSAASTAQAGDIPWSSLSAEEQRTLSRARDNWDQLPTGRQQRLLEGARRWQHMNPQQREQARDRWQERREDKRDRFRERQDRN